MRPPSSRRRLFVEHDLGELSGSAIDAARRAGHSTPHPAGVNMLRNASFQGVLPPSGQQISAEAEGSGRRVHPLYGPQRPPGLCSPAPRAAPRAPRRQDQRVQTGHRPSPAGYCLTPTAELSKTERGPISTSGPSVLSMSPNRTIPSVKSNFSSPLAAAQPLTILSWLEALNAGSSRRA